MRVLGNNRGPVPWAGSARQHGPNQSSNRSAVPGRWLPGRDLVGNLPVLRWRHR